MTTKELVNETVEYYRNHPRAYDTEKEKCMYKTSNGDMCAVGRCLKPNSCIFGYESGIIWIALTHDLPNELKFKYKDIKPDTWRKLQDLHDIPDHWIIKEKGNELSERGKNYIKDHFGFEYGIH